MLKIEVESIFEENKKKILSSAGVQSATEPLAIILGGQPAAGKSSLTEVAKADYLEIDFLVINGDNYRDYHPYHEEVFYSDIENYSKETQIFSNVFTEGLINEAIKNRYNVIIEGTMRNPETPYKTARLLRKAGFKVAAYAIAAPAIITEIGVFNRYQEEVIKKGAGRLSDLDAHHAAVTGLPISLDTLYEKKAVDRISIHTYRSKERVKDFNCIDGEWDVTTPPSYFIEQARNQQLADKEFLSETKQEGAETLKKLSPELKPLLKASLTKINKLIK